MQSFSIPPYIVPGSTELSGQLLAMVTLEWVTWFNQQRLLEPIGYIPPAEAEQRYYLQLAEQAEPAGT